MTETLLAVPVLAPMLAAALGVLLPRPAVNRFVHGAAVVSVLITSIMLALTLEPGRILFVTFGGWDYPFGISFLGDYLSVGLVCVSSIVFLAGLVYGFGEQEPLETQYGYHSMVMLLFAAVNGSFLTADLFNLFVWFELMLLSSFVLFSYEHSKIAVGGSLKYVLQSLISSAFFLVSLALIYSSFGTLNLLELAALQQQKSASAAETLAFVLLIGSFSLKAGLFPLCTWLPAVYHVARHPVSAVCAGLLTKVGVYALIRLFSLLIHGDTAWLYDLLYWIALTSIVFGVIGATAQYNIRRILSFHIISQVGFIVLALSLNSAAGTLAAVCYLFHHIFAKTNLFFTAGVLESVFASPDVRRHGGLARRSPLVSGGFLIASGALSGIPPLSGFFAKLLVFYALLSANDFVGIFVAAAAGMLTLYSMVKVWNESFAKPAPAETTIHIERLTWYQITPIVTFAVLTCLMGLGVPFFFEYGTQCAEQLTKLPAYAALAVEEATR